MKVNVEIPDYSDEEEWETRNGITLVGGFTYEWYYRRQCNIDYS